MRTAIVLALAASLAPLAPLATLAPISAAPMPSPGAPAPAAPAGQASSSSQVAPRIVNGLPSAGSPSVGLFVNATSQGVASCTATLIGCRTVLTAAHCVCTDPDNGQILSGAACAKRWDLVDPSTKSVFFQHAGTFQVSSVAVHPAFVFGQASDLAVIKLAAPVTGIAPSPIDTMAKPRAGTPGVIVGFGVSGDLSSGAGIKRSGSVTVAACSAAGVDGANQVCVNFGAPLGAAGSNSGACFGDSGGPLFVTAGAATMIAGTTSGGDSASATCAPPNHLWFSDVFKDRAWIETAAGTDLGTGACGGLPAAGGPNARVTGAMGTLSSAHRSDLLQVAVPAGTTHLRVGLTADDFVANDYSLYLKRGAAPTTSSFDCKSDGAGTLELCDVAAPAAGTWNVLVQGGGGTSPGGAYELVTTLFSPVTVQPCVPSPTRLCLDDQPGDRRFQVDVAYMTAQGGGHSGAGNAVPLSALGVRHGGLFWFFSPDNPEMQVKVLNACALKTPRFWVFFSAGTNAGFTVTVTDTAKGHSKTYSNPDRHAALAVDDTDALPCG